jgi:hypothetical protein
MKLQYLQPIDSVSGFGAGLAALGKGAKETADWSLKRMDEDRKYQLEATQAEYKNKYYGSLTDLNTQQHEQNKELFTFTKTKQEYEADLAKYQANEAQLTLEQRQERAKAFPLSMQVKAAATFARKANSEYFKGMDDYSIAALKEYDPESYDYAVKGMGSYTFMGQGFKDGKQYGYFANPNNGKTVTIPMGDMPDDGSGSGKASDYYIDTFKNADGSPTGFLRVNKKTGAYEMSEVKGTTADRAIVSTDVAEKVLGKLGKELTSPEVVEINDRGVYSIPYTYLVESKLNGNSTLITTTDYGSPFIVLRPNIKDSDVFLGRKFSDDKTNADSSNSYSLHNLFKGSNNGKNPNPQNKVLKKNNSVNPLSISLSENNDIPSLKDAIRETEQKKNPPAPNNKKALWNLYRKDK